MKKLATLLLIFTGVLMSYSQQNLWKKEQLMDTKELADKINTKAKDLPLIFNVGPMEAIKTAVNIGLGTSVTAMEKLKSTLSMENKNRVVVVYCGCCSYANCPNIKPAYDALIKGGFKNAKVLDLPEGVKPDWVAKGYPMEGDK
ncbi:MAG: rhodanese-like domain-containing protein [Bacteroidota bacterium]|nr:rhodanese-like domain-containing protein [Bacteroidota bacterium]